MIDSDITFDFTKHHTGKQIALVTESKNVKHKKEVCLYWLQNRCQLGSECKFLHSMDYSKMPMCPYGETCSDQDCTYKHQMPTEKIACPNYQLGFCSFGRRCAYRHDHLEMHAPEVSKYWTKEYAAFELVQTLGKTRTFQKKECEYYQSHQWCPYFDACKFKHTVQMK